MIYVRSIHHPAEEVENCDNNHQRFGPHRAVQSCALRLMGTAGIKKWQVIIKLAYNVDIKYMVMGFLLASTVLMLHSLTIF